MKTTPIAHVMTSRVHALGPDAKLSEVRRVLREEHCHHVPIVDGGKLVGIVSARDLIRVVRAAAQERAADVDEILDGGATLADVMTRDPVTIELDESVDRAIELIADGALHSVLVVDARGHLAGIVTDTDLLAYLG